MKFTIVGADKDTGENIEMTVSADDEKAAEEVAHRKGILVSRVTALEVQSPPLPAPNYPAAIQQPLEQGHYLGAPVINIAPPRRGNSLGVASLVLGILAFLICWIPLVNLLGVPLAALGLLLGLIGLLVAFTRKGASIGYPIAGSAVCGLALFVAISLTGALVGGLNRASEELVKQAEQRNATNQTPVLTERATIGTKPVSDSSITVAEQPALTGAVPDVTPPTSPPAVTPPTPTKPTDEWVSAETPVRQGDVQVKINSVKVGKVATKSTYGDGTGKSTDSLLSIELEVANLSDTKKFDYRTWGGDAVSIRGGSTLTDNFDNAYKIIHFGFGSKVAGSVESESVYPGKAVKDVIVFEEPVSKAEFLNLALPAKQFGGTGLLRIRIPASMIGRERPDIVPAQVGQSGASFFGIEAAGSRFAYIVDVSASMDEFRLSALRRELQKSIEGLLETSEFMIVKYSTESKVIGEASGWQEALPAAKRKMKFAIDGLMPEDNTLPVPGFTTVFSHRPKPDAIYFMTDGDFSDTDADVIIKLHETFKSPVHCICLGFQGGEPRMKKIARATKGTYTFVRVGP